MGADTAAMEGGADRTLRETVARHAPFAQMSPAGVDAFLAGAKERRFRAGERVLEPEDGPVEALLLILSGTVTGQRDSAPPGAAALETE